MKEHQYKQLHNSQLEIRICYIGHCVPLQQDSASSSIHFVPQQKGTLFRQFGWQLTNDKTAYLALLNSLQEIFFSWRGREHSLKRKVHSCHEILAK